MAKNQTSAKNRQRNRGFIVTELMTMGIILMSVAGIAAATKYAFASFESYQSKMELIERESILVAALQSEQVLQNLRTQLLASRDNPGSTIEIPTETGITYPKKGDPTQSMVVARQGRVIWLDRNGEECNIEGCAKTKVRLDIRCERIEQATLCSAAYRMLDAQTLATVGSPTTTGDFETEGFNNNTDYVVPIPFELASREASEECGPEAMFASGFNKSNGTMYCVQRPNPANACASSSIAVGIEYDSGTRTMNVVCQPLRNVQCNTNYVLQSFSTLALHPTGPRTAPGTCVFGAQQTVPFRNLPSTPAVSIAGTYCPIHYQATGANCTLQGVSPTAGTCWNTCLKTTGDGLEYYDYCPTYPGPNSGTIRNQHTTRGHMCWVEYPASQPCGAQWTANAQLVTGSCTLDTVANPVNIPAALDR